MPRRPNTRPTSIYWLVDMRPETLATWPNGYPFYCGKTVKSIKERLRGHRHDALKSKRPVCEWVKACGIYLRIIRVQTVPAGESWALAERRWIQIMRANFPVCANIADGGEGSSGYVPSEAVRARMKGLNAGRKLSAETRAKISAGVKARYCTPEELQHYLLTQKEMARFAEAKARGVDARRLNKRVLAKIRDYNVRARQGKNTQSLTK